MRPARRFLAFALAALPCAAAGEYEDALQRFASALRGLREGDVAASAALEPVCEELCARFERCDARGVAKFYATLSPEARVRGLEDEARFLELWDRVHDAGSDGVVGGEWREERAQVVRELRALADAAAERPDFVPAAQARSLIARIEVQRLESDPTLRGVERGLVERAAAEDANAALELFARAGQQTPQLEPTWLLGRLALLTGDATGARARFLACAEGAERLRRDEFRENAIGGLLALARGAGDAREEDRLLESLARFRDPRVNWPLARDWAARLLAQDHAEAALEFLARFEPAADEHVLDRLERELLLGSAKLRRGDTRAAREHFESIAAESGGELSILALSTLALREERAFEAAGWLGDEERVASFSPLGRQRALGLLGEALLELGDVDGAIARLSQAFESALESERQLLEERRDRVSRAAAGVIGERLGLHTVALLADALSRDGRALEAAAVVEEAQARTLRRASSTESRIDESAMRAWAARYELGLVTWVVGADFAVAAHVSPDGVATCARIEHGRAALEQAVRRMREAALDRGARERLAGVAEEIARALFPPEIAARLSEARGGKWPRLLALAHGPIESLPLELLPWERLAGRADVALDVLPGLWASEPGPEAAPWELAQWTILGAPLDAGGGDLLPGARAELDAVRDLHPGSTLAAGPAFGRASLIEALRGSRAVHVATHMESSCGAGLVFGDAALVTSGGESVCADDVGWLAPKLPLVVLGACWSGGGEFVDAEGLYGLARAFLASGTRNLIVTQWPVEDSAAAAFGVAFHRELASGAVPSRAAAIARDELARSGASPADFGAFRALARD